MSYSFSGHMMIVPARNIKRIERNSVDILKYTMSGGIVKRFLSRKVATSTKKDSEKGKLPPNTFTSGHVRDAGTTMTGVTQT
jgi:uncharacterized membrane protein